MQILCKKSITRKDIVKIRYLEEEFDEKALWKAVLCQAIDDATSGSGQRKRLYAKRKAIKWLTEDNEDFRIVCHLAGYSPKIVKDNINEMIKPVYGLAKPRSKQIDLFELLEIKTG